jgi:sugar lactone lactonase YvrE
MKRIFWLPVVIVLVLAVWLGLWPVPIEPVAWHAPGAPGYTGAHATNTRLVGLRHIALNGEVGPEHVAYGADGKLYVGVASGKILRMKPDGSALEVFSVTGGRPLGLAFDTRGRLVAADAIKGLLSISGDGKATVLADAVAGGPIRFANAVAVAGSGKIYFTDSSMRFAPAQWGSTLEAATLDVLEQSATGRVLEYDPATKAVRVVAQGLSLANGIALSSDEHSVFVSESGRYRVWRIAAAAEQLDVAHQSAQAKVLFDNLPGYPDNLTRGLDGKIWLGFGGQRNDLDAMAERPFLRRVVLRIPRFLWKPPKPYGHVMAFTEDGKVVADLQDPTGDSPITTGLTETAERLYIHNVNGKGLGWLAR